MGTSQFDALPGPQWEKIMKNFGFGKMACMAVAFCIASAITSQAQGLSTLLSFDTSTGNYGNSLAQGTDGNLFGTTAQSGPNNGGTAYEISPGGDLLKVLSFCSEANCADGGGPQAPLLLASNGNFYGTTGGGGANGKGGTVFSLSPAGQLTTLYSFCSAPECADGSGPSILVEGRDGNLYGITGGGGGGHQCFAGSAGCGTVFTITAAGVLTRLHSFCTQASCLDGSVPSSLVLGTDGNFYGTATQGNSSCFDGCGTIFRISPGGSLTVLYTFTTPAQGSYPNGVIEGTDGNFYGTTRVGGSFGNGTVFQFTGGELNVLYNFCASSNCSDGAVPWSGLVQGSDGNFYGTTNDGGTGTNCPGLGGTPCGTAFKISSTGEFTSLYSFCHRAGCTDGGVPLALLIQRTDGAFYGTTSEGAETGCFDGCGTAFRLSVGLGPFVQANPVFGKDGFKISILGSNLNGATSVTFNGTPATFTVVSNSLIKATVPAGATTGTIEVTTPGGVLASNVAFQILP
jgi:uncharacterized repeat protein (TIGR03803 family)